MLRTRILVIATAIVLLVIGLLVYGAWLRDQGAREAQDQLRLDALAQTWALRGTSAIEHATAVIMARLEASAAIEAVAERDGPLLAGLGGSLFGRDPESEQLLRTDLYGLDGNLLFSTDTRYFALHLLGQGEILPLATDQRLVGARVGEGTLLGLSMVPLQFDGERVGTATIVLDLAPSIEAMARAMDAEIAVLDRAGRLVLATGSDLSAALPRGLAIDRPALVEVVDGDRRLELASTLAVDVGGGRSATLVVIRDITRLAERQRFIDLAWLLGALLIGLGPLVLLWFYLRRAFEPLDEAVEAVRQLAAGRTDHYAELGTGADEIGDIGRAIEVFRQNTLALERNADLEARRRRRQARFIRRQMMTLSETLDEEAQASAMEDLRHIETAVADGSPTSQDGTRFSDELGLIGVALERMTARVRSQQQALSELIDELREALEMKTRLISLEQELDIARQMQQNVLPRRFPDTPGFEIAAVMEPAREVGGDFYDIFQIDAHRVGIAVADVSGKGIPAAFFMLIARTLLKAIALEGAGPGRTLARLNDFLCGDNEETMFVTLFYGELDSRSGRFVYSNGGHNHPYLATPNAEVTALPSTDGMALAVFEQVNFPEKQTILGPGHRLVLYTDGVTEAFDDQGEMFGDARLAALLESDANHTAPDLLATILDSLERFSAGAPQSDDITVIVIAGRPEGETRAD